MLYVSSANRTGRQPAISAAQAAAMFGETVPILRADEWPDAEPRRGATTMLRLRPDGAVELVRRGAQGDAFAGPSAYLADLRRRC